MKHFVMVAAVVVDAVDVRALDGFKLGLMQTSLAPIPSPKPPQIPYQGFPRENVVNHPQSFGT